LARWWAYGHAFGLSSRPLLSCQDVGVAYDEGLATRLRDLVAGEPGLAEKKMFGGLALLLDGNMAVGVHGDALIVRTEPSQQERLMAEAGVRVFDVTGRPMKGWLLVDPAGCAEDEDLRRWIDRGVAFARSLPPK
jgi:TfoX/Sxy family transcriptional regulator of competence genes